MKKQKEGNHLILKTKLFGHHYEFKSLREVMAKANEEKSGDKLRRLCYPILPWRI